MKSFMGTFNSKQLAGLSLAICLVFSILPASSIAQTAKEDSLYNKAVYYYQFNKYDSVASALQQILLINPKSAKAYNLYGGVYSKQKEYEKAIEMFKKGIEADSSDSYLLYQNLANTYIDLGNFNEAINIHKNLIRKDSTNDDAYVDLGDAYMKNKDTLNALQSFNKAVILNPYNTLARFNLGSTYVNTEDYKQAIDELFYVRMLNGKFPGIQTAMTSATNEAESFFNDLVENERNNSDAHYYYSFVLFYDDEKVEAIEALEKAIKLKGTEEKYYLLKALWLWNTQKYEESINECHECLKLNPNNWMCNQELALNYSYLSKPDSALKYIQKAVELDSQVISSLMLLGEVFGQIKNYEQAVAPLEKVVQLSSQKFDNNPIVYYDLALIYYNLKDYKKSLEYAEIARYKHFRQEKMQDSIKNEMDLLIKEIEIKLNK